MKHTREAVSDCLHIRVITLATVPAGTAGLTIQNGLDVGGGAIKLSAGSGPILSNLVLFNNTVSGCSE